jgi:hypothetical protein
MEYPTTGVTAIVNIMVDNLAATTNHFNRTITDDDDDDDDHHHHRCCCCDALVGNIVEVAVVGTLWLSSPYVEWCAVIHIDGSFGWSVE